MTREKDRPDEVIEHKAETGPKIAKSGKKTKINSKRIIIVFVLCLGVILSLVTLQAQFKSAGNTAQELERNYRLPQPDGFAELAAGMRSDRRPAQVVVPEITVDEPVRQRDPEPAQRIVINVPRQERIMPLPRPRYYSNQHDAQLAQTLRTMRLQALTAKPVVENFEISRNATQVSISSSQNSVSGVDPAIMDSSMMAALMQQGQQSDPNGQAGKIDFLRNSGGSLTPQGYSANLPVPQQFPYELKAGTIIPGIMISGINSDLPGSIIAQVSENVWDTATGRYVLIPKGTRILGVYDSEVTFGQRRVLMVWNRLIFPNGTTLDIAGSPGVDQAGYSGLSGRVNEHWGKMIQAALLASVFVAGAELVYDSDSGIGNENRSPSDVAAESAAGAILDMGTRLVNRASDIQPTITMRPGKRMGIFVQRDIVFPYPYF